jgi:hypothetical protein
MSGVDIVGGGERGRDAFTLLVRLRERDTPIALSSSISFLPSINFTLLGTLTTTHIEFNI